MGGVGEHRGERRSLDTVRCPEGDAGWSPESRCREAQMCGPPEEKDALT